MQSILWTLNRLKAMNIKEVAWRVRQELVKRSERKLYRERKVAVVDHVFEEKLSNLHVDARKLFINNSNDIFSLDSSIHLLADFDYEKYKTDWFAGFQTKSIWPLKWVYEFDYKQQDYIGDARTNWELNRHFQFALLAKDYYASKDQKYLKELVYLFNNWNDRNPFLWGISWTSVMEIAIRCSNWCWMYAFLSIAENVEEIMLRRIEVGIINMASYIAKHYSQFSSANNHLIVEMYAIGQVGILCDYNPWIECAVSILTREFQKQNYSDGVNKELSLHYQCFYMEAMGLMERLLIKNKIDVPDLWNSMLKKMSKYVRDCMGDYGEVVEFGDNDEGKILDLHGGEDDYYKYVLGIMNYLLDCRYVDNKECSENLYWLFTNEERKAIFEKKIYKPDGSVCYEEGGNSILRSRDRKVLIGIDHAALGFGSIAAHGHADALSFQMFMQGQPVFIDPGTYIYHCDLPGRNAFRKTENHNTVCIGGRDQSEMLGAFLWGRKAECKLITKKLQEDVDIIAAEHDGYAPDNHKRQFSLQNNELLIQDQITTGNGWIIGYQLSDAASDIDLQLDRLKVSFRVKNCMIEMAFESEKDLHLSLVDSMVSSQYGKKNQAKKVLLQGKGTASVFTSIYAKGIVA